MPKSASPLREGPLVGLTRNTVLLAISSLFSDIATEMLYPILPVFLTQTLGASGSVVGLIEGVATATQNIVQGLSGAVSDRLKRRKPVALVGYVVAALAKPLIGLAPVWPMVLGARFLDRLGTGVRSAPRDALIAASADEAHRGKAFGLEGVGDNAGAFFGPLIAVLILSVWPGAYRPIFLLAVIPGMLAMLMVSLVSEKKDGQHAEATLDAPLPRFPAAYHRYLLVSALFGLGNSSNAFLILQTRDIGASLQTTILIYAGFNLVAAIVSYPIGALSDRLGRRTMLALAYAVFAVSYLGFAVSRSPMVIAGLFLLYGVFQGAFRAAGKALAVDLAPRTLRASGIGWYGTAVGLSGLIASLVAGLLWDKVGHAAVFAWGVGFSLIGLIALFRLVPRRHDKPAA
ncbi:MAG: MFS transporter [Caulobacteraceae bacterium]